jgi:hypothetical protein
MADLAVDEVHDRDGGGDAAPAAGERGGASRLVGLEVGEDPLERIVREGAQAISAAHHHLLRIRYEMRLGFGRETRI